MMRLPSMLGMLSWRCGVHCLWHEDQQMRACNLGAGGAAVECPWVHLLARGSIAEIRRGISSLSRPCQSCGMPGGTCAFTERASERHMRESCHTCDCMSRVTHMNESHMRTHTNTSCHTCEWVMSRIYLSPHVNLQVSCTQKITGLFCKIAL